MNKIELLYIDLFCGAGGTSSGVEYATVDGRKCAEVVACVNHDDNNAVEVNMSRVLCEALARKLMDKAA